MRLFVAIELPDEVRGALARGLGELRRVLPRARWVRAEALHITLKFLGEQPAEVVEPLAAALARELAPLAPVAVRLGGAGFFPRAERARVAWVGGIAPGMERWAAGVEAAAAAVGIPREERPFSLHLTLARLERPWGGRAVDDFTVRVGKWSLPPFVAREAVVFRSELHPTGAVYTALRRMPAGGG